MARAALIVAVGALAATVVFVAGAPARAPTLTEGSVQAHATCARPPTVPGGAPAGAILSATKQTGDDPRTSEIVVARGDGSGACVIARGQWSSVSPDGSWVAVADYQAGGASTPKPKLSLYAIGGRRPSRPVGGGCREVFWSPDSKKLACVNGGYGKLNNLLLITVGSGATKRLATGFVEDFRVAFSPDSKRLAYVQLRSAASLSGELKVIDLASRSVTTLRDGARNPVWGANAIAFVTLSTRGQQTFANLAVIRPDGTGFRQLTSLQSSGPAPIFGYAPVAWSADGGRLLAVFGGGQVATAYAIDPIRGRARLISTRVWPFALNRDGRYVIGQTPVAFSGGFVSRSNVLRVPWTGGKERILLRSAANPSLSA